MRVAIGSDHAGYDLRQEVAPILRAAGHEVIDVGTEGGADRSVDYPVYAYRAAHLVADGEADRAIVVCGSGVGVSIAANKLDGIRAVNGHDAEEAEMSRRHNDANVLTLAGRRLGRDEAAAIVASFLDTDFEAGRHERRVSEISELERGAEL